MDKKKLILIGMLIFLIFSLVNAELNNQFKQEVNQINKQTINLSLEKDYYSSVLDFEKIETIAQEVANSHEYKLNVFDCTDFSKELVNKLKENGYTSRCTAGNYWLSDYTNHTWVSVWINGNRFEIESTNGYFISNEDYKTYEVNWENYCW